MAGYRDRKNPNNLVEIETARDQKAINEAASNGFWPLIKRVQPSKIIHSKFSVFQSRSTGKIEVTGDFRAGFNTGGDMEMVIGWSSYYPHTFPSPYAAYLIPRNLKTGEKVWIKDLIEDFIGGTWNQGSVFRLESAEAIWNGKDLKIQYDPNKDISTIIG